MRTAATYERNAHGRYRAIAIQKRLTSRYSESFDITAALHAKLAKRLSAKPDLSAQYNAFLAEYEKLGHMI